ncbi:heat-inducible transcriptional repressor HrcA [Aliikangiella coralliicola]|uniref:Heat-inducible transcription repressor HrcA n=1 Tax=Aliikangiella coralliicola TaxID=2592383 RepID=A0A545UGR2_9GAMM|nr:heat-inducible transcriptional repressor HrcA [Aliikangiella coralliicola]TQV88639.1 heat-inducible transcription repressor HrcA [Aliikangiella coralliicola]
MKNRDLILMKSLIESYVREGHPVGSKALLRSSHLSVSTATIRNVMADLERQGLLLSPHTSAGRIPTTQGLRIFVDQLVQVKSLGDDTMEHLKHSLNPGQETNTILGNASSVLSEMTRMASLVQIPSKPFQKLEHIDFVPLSDNRILVVLVLQNEEIQNRVIRVERGYSREELSVMANFLNHHIAGKDLNTARENLLQQMINEQRQLDELTRQAIKLAEQGLETESGAENKGSGFHFSGQTNLVSMATHGQLENLERIFQAFKQKQQILSILERSLVADGVKIFIGEESGNQNLHDCSIVTAPYKLNGESIGVLAVVGPTRMRYDKVIPIVDVTAKLLSNALTMKSSVE